MPVVPGRRELVTGSTWIRWIVALLLLWPAAVWAQLTPDQQADMLLQSARRAFNEKNHAFAVTRFREFLQKFGGHREAPSARYGLALALLEGPAKDYAGAVEQLQQLAGNKQFPDHPFALYYLGLARRGQGVRELASANAKPQAAGQHRAAAQQRFDEAGKHFAAAAAAFAAQLPGEVDWAACARCDQAEMQVRTGKAKEAQATAAPFLQDAALAKSRYRPLGLYYHGHASFLLKEYLIAGRSLSVLAPFEDSVFGTHARYLLARVHHLTDERAEAALHYAGVVADHEKQRKASAALLQKPATFNNDPEERARLEALVKGPPPEHVAQAVFNLAVLQYEDGRFGEALPRLVEFAKANPQAPLALEAQLRIGYCQVQLKQFADALKTLTPLVDKEPKLTDQVLFWIAKAQAGAADPNNPKQFEPVLKTALDTFRRAADRAQQMTANDPDARGRRGEILLEMADAQQRLRQFKEAAGTYGALLAEKLLPGRDEEVLQRQITALHLGNEYAESDKLVQRFQQTFPKSTLLPAVLFRHAENAYFQALTAEKRPDLPDRAKALAAMYDVTAQRYQVVVEKFPEFAHVNLARHGWALVFYHKGDLEKSKSILDTIPVPDRSGDLATVPYLIADILLRTAPATADDALTAGRLEEQLKGAIELLESFVGGQPNSPQTPDALLKLGLAYQRMSALLAQPPEKAKMLAAARTRYELLIKQFKDHALMPQAVFERAKCLAQANDRGGAIKELSQFQNDPLRKTAVAPMAVLRLAILLREQNKAADAAAALAQCRQQHEPALLKDPERVAWVPLLQYHHGLALKESGKLPEARGVFEGVVKQFGSRPEAAESAMRWAQCMKEEGGARLESARKARAAAKKPEEQAAAQKTFDDGQKAIQEAVRYLEKQEDQLKARQPAPDVRARTLYELAWAARLLADLEVAGVREKLQLEQRAKLEAAAKKSGRPMFPLPDVPLTAVPLQPAEQKARAAYGALIAAFSDLPLATDARFELAELLADRGEHDPALKLLNEALDREPPNDLTERIRLRMGDCYVAKKDAKLALAQFEAVAQNPKSPLAGQSRYRAGECLLLLGDPAAAVKHLTVFRDQGPFQNLPGLTDRALFRLGHAYARLNQWDQSRQAHEQVVGRFGGSPWVHEARYGIGWAWQNQKQFDNAVNAYTPVTAATATELGAKAQLQIGLCRLEQKRFADAATALLVVPHTYGYPEPSAAALCEAARALAESKQTGEAVKLLQRVLKEHPDSKWAAVAKERLAGLR